MQPCAAYDHHLRAGHDSDQVGAHGGRQEEAQEFTFRYRHCYSPNRLRFGTVHLRSYPVLFTAIFLQYAIMPLYLYIFWHIFDLK